jgi:hypothetical protein
MLSSAAWVEVTQPCVKKPHVHNFSRTQVFAEVCHRLQKKKNLEKDEDQDPGDLNMISTMKVLSQNRSPNYASSPFPLSISTTSLSVSSRAPYLAAVPRAVDNARDVVSPFSKTAKHLLSPQSWPLTGDRGVGLGCLYLIGAPPPDDGAAKINPDLAANQGQRIANFDPADPSSLLTTIYNTPDLLKSSPFSLETTPDSLHPGLGGTCGILFVG